MKVLANRIRKKLGFGVETPFTKRGSKEKVLK
jgi:hypothetical protein